MRREEKKVWKERGETIGVNERGENKEEWSITVQDEKMKQIMYLKDRAGQYHKSYTSTTKRHQNIPTNFKQVMLTFG